jgi:hypothetical protein
VQFISNVYFPPSLGASIGAVTSPGAMFNPAINNQITLPAGNYLFMFAFSCTNQVDLAFTTSISSLASAAANILPSTHMVTNVNRTFAPIVAYVNLTGTTNLYLVNFANNPTNLGVSKASPLGNYNLGYLSILKIE